MDIAIVNAARQHDGAVTVYIVRRIAVDTGMYNDRANVMVSVVAGVCCGLVT